MARSRKNNKKTISTLILLGILLVYYLFFAPSEEKQNDSPVVFEQDGVYVHFIDVGQGDAALVQTKDGNLLIDTGTTDSRETLLACIDALEITTFDYAIFTHPHADHIGGAAKVLKNYKVETVILPNAVNTNYTFENMMDAIEQENCEVIEGKAGISFSLGDTKVDLLAPVYEDDSNLNNTSVVAKVTYGEVSFLFTGDAEIESESAMLLTDEDALDADILKLGHHGSSTSSSWDFLNAVSPEIAVASCGYENEYGHPHREVVSRLGELNVPLYRTYETGNIVVFTDGTTYQIQTEK